MEAQDLAKRPSDAGFSLVEVVMAMLVLTVAILALIPVQTKALAGVLAAEQRQQATGYADAALERVRARATSAYASVSQGRVPSASDPVDAAYTSEEPLLTSAGSSPDPALVTRTCSEASGCVTSGGVVGTAFTTRVYVSQPGPASTSLVTVTAVTTWRSQADPGTADRSVVLRTRITGAGAP